MATTKLETWWNAKKDTLPQKVMATVGYHENDQSSFRNLIFEYEALYGNSPFRRSRAKQISNNHIPYERVTLNVIKSMIDTLVEKITKNEPKPEFITMGGDIKLQRRTIKLNQFIEGAFHDSDLYDSAIQVFKDACIYGTGILKVFEKDDNIAIERITQDELIIDRRESINGKFVQCHQVQYVNRYTLADQYPEQAKKIMEVSSDGGFNNTVVQSMDTDMVKVVESWRLPIGGKGRHCICINGTVLFDEEYDKKVFPFAFIRIYPPQKGFWGDGIAKALLGIQFQINKILYVTQKSMQWVVPKVFCETGSQVDEEQLDDEEGGIIWYSGMRPVAEQLLKLPPELLSQVTFLMDQAYKVIGVSQLSAQAKKPAGLDSAVGLREYHDIETERFLSFGKAYERFFGQVAHLMIDIAKDISDKTGNFKVNTKMKGKKFLQTITWKDIDLDQDAYRLADYPISHLPSSPAGRLQHVTEMVQAGMATPEEGRHLLRLPDLEAFEDLQEAPRENLLSILDKMVDEKEYFEPEMGFQDLELGIKLFTQAYNEYQLNGMEDDVLDLIRKWIDAANALIAGDQQAQQPQAPAQPLGVPQAPPTSDLLPISTAPQPQ